VTDEKRTNGGTRRWPVDLDIEGRAFIDQIARNGAERGQVARAVVRKHRVGKQRGQTRRPKERPARDRDIGVQVNLIALPGVEIP
jgi:hypothetical protein